MVEVASSDAALSYATFLGKENNENNNGITVDARSAAYITGEI